ncbi:MULTISPECIES: HPP family protein [unclassified Leucobacter]|uniref:HPP family protein n=1 Tax=unclassified Leucobacter TaxID=2621730 RepID=UPI003017B177
MSSGSKSRKQRDEQDEASQRARRKQFIVALVIGAVVGVVIAALTQFWLWLPAGLAMGLATGAIMKPPTE